MLLPLLNNERMKLKHSPVWLAFLILPVVPALLGTLNYRANIEILQNEWYSLWTQHTLFTSYFFLPIMIGIYCSYLIQCEHQQHNWNKLLTMPVPRYMIFAAKLTVVSFMILLSELWIAVLFIASGTIAGISSTPPYHSLAAWCLLGTLGGMVMAALQLGLALFIKSFARSVVIAFAGGLSGLVFLAKDLGNIWPYSLMAYGMNSNAPQQLMKTGYVPFVLTCTAYILLFAILSSKILAKKDW